MKLLTEKIKKKAKEQYQYGSDIDKQDVVAKFFNPMGAGTWYLLNMDKDEDYAWGIVDLMELEMGSFSMKELQSIKLPLGLTIERDLYFPEIPAVDLWSDLVKAKQY
jgi:hypothetical protein